MTLRNSNCRSIMGIMMECPHLLHGTVASGARSPGMKTFVSHQPQVTIFSGLSLALILIRIYHRPHPNSCPACNAFTGLRQR